MKRTILVFATAALLTGLLVPGSAMALKVGERAPNFKLPSTTGKDISLSQYKGKQMVLIEFYHADFGPT